MARSLSGTLWNLSSHDSVKMEIVDHALHAMSDEVMVPHSGWERGNVGGEESCKPRHLEWETALTNTTGCLRYIALMHLADAFIQRGLQRIQNVNFSA